MSSRPALLLGAVAALVLTGCGSSQGGGTAPAPDASRLAGTSLYVDPDSSPAKQVRLLQAAQRSQDAAAVADRIANRPIARWFTGDGDPFLQARELSTAAAAAGQVPVLAVYDLPGRDCGLYSAGGAPDDEAYTHYVGSLAAGLGDRPAVVVLEPDAVAHSLSGCGSAPERGRALLRAAVDMLTRQPGTRVYLDAGNATWVDDLPGLAAALRDSGVEQADGFALNVSNYEETGTSVAYGQRLSDLLGGAHFVVDTSRNGAGPPSSADDAAGAHAWCNPPGRRLGTDPTTDPGAPRVDALLWVKSPGDSDGTCHPGDLPAGQWSAALAQDLLG